MKRVGDANENGKLKIQKTDDSKELLAPSKEEIEEMMKELSTEMEKKVSQLEAKISSYTTISTRLGKNQVIKLNIGGSIFTTSLPTLTSVKDTFFTGYFNDHFNPTPEEDGAFFIDRPSKHFELILNYLRGIDVTQWILLLDECDLCDFIEEVVYYQITPLYDMLPRTGMHLLQTKYNITCASLIVYSNAFDMDYCSSRLVVSQFGKRVKKQGRNNWNSCVLGEEGNRFKVKLITLKDGGLMIGFAPRTINLKRSNTDIGYYLNIYIGTLHSKTNECSPYTNTKIVQGSVVEGRLDNGNISFHVNGEDMGIAFSNVPLEPKLYPAFDVCMKGTEFEFVE